MRDIVLARMDKTRPALILTRELARPHQARVSVAPITSTSKGLSSEVRLGPRNGLDHDCVASLDNVMTIHTSQIGRHLGSLLNDQEVELTLAVLAAFDIRLG